MPRDLSRESASVLRQRELQKWRHVQEKEFFLQDPEQCVEVSKRPEKKELRCWEQGTLILLAAVRFLPG